MRSIPSHALSIPRHLHETYSKDQRADDHQLVQGRVHPPQARFKAACTLLARPGSRRNRQIADRLMKHSARVVDPFTEVMTTDSRPMDEIALTVVSEVRHRRNGGSQFLNRAFNRVQLLELASDAHELFLGQEPMEKRRLLAFMVSSASWKEGELSVNLRQPFNLIRDGIAAATAAERS